MDNPKHARIQKKHNKKKCIIIFKVVRIWELTMDARFTYNIILENPFLMCKIVVFEKIIVA